MKITLKDEKYIRFEYNEKTWLYERNNDTLSYWYEDTSWTKDGYWVISRHVDKIEVLKILDKYIRIKKLEKLCM